MASLVTETQDDPADGGYATAAAALMALAMSLAVSAVASASLTDLRAARAAFARAKTEAILDGVHRVGVTAILETGQSVRLRWYAPTGDGAVEVLAEPETPKVGLKLAADLADGDLFAFGPGVTASTRSRLRALALSEGSAADLAKLATGPLWRGCAPSVISPYGRGGALTLAPAKLPAAGQFNWRAGEVWRVRALAPNGWADDRIIRLTGDPEHPAAIIERAFVRGQRGGEPCAVFIERSQ